MLALTDLTVRFPAPEHPSRERVLRKMLAFAHRDGIRTLCFVSRASSGARAEESADEKMLLACAKEFPELRIKTAAELFLKDREDTAFAPDDLPTVGQSDTLLVSLDPEIRADLLFEMLMRLRGSGRGILLHAPDAVICLQKQPSLAQRLSELGILFQISAGSVLGENGLVRKRFSSKMLREDRVFSIASDASDHLYHPPRLSKCYLKLCRTYGEAFAYRLLIHAPLSLLGLADTI